MNEPMDEKALTAFMLANLSDNSNTLQLGIEVGDALATAAGINVPPPFCLVFGLPDGTLSRITNMDPEGSLLMLAELVKMAARGSPEKHFIATATKQ